MTRPLRFWLCAAGINMPRQRRSTRDRTVSFVIEVYRERHDFRPGQTVHLRPRREFAYIFDHVCDAHVFCTTRKRLGRQSASADMAPRA